jgi:hypothetical protein
MALEKVDIYSELRRLMMHSMKPENENEQGKISQLLQRTKEALLRIERMRRMSPDIPRTACKLSPYIFRIVKNAEHRNRR